MEKKRLDYLDMVKGIGIILVVIGHSEYLAYDALTVISAFHMPLFFIISGMLIYHTGEEKRPMKQILLRKLKSIMLPYVIFSLIYLAVYGGYFCRVAGYLTPQYIREIAVQAVSLDGISVLWFLSALFLAEILFLGIRKKCSAGVTVIVTAALALAACLGKPWLSGMIPDHTLWQKGISGFISTLLRGMTGAGFLMLGYVTMEAFSIRGADGKEKTDRRSMSHRIAGLLLGVLCLVLMTVLSLYNGSVDLHYMKFQNLPVYIICAYAGTLGLILICRNIPAQKWLAYLGANSLIIMVTHLDCQFMLLSIRVGQFFVALSPYAKWYCFYFGIALGMTVLELVTIYVVNHFLPFLVGKKYNIGRNARRKGRKGKLSEEN